MFKKTKLRNGDPAWSGTPEFTKRMNALEPIIRDAIEKAKNGIAPVLSDSKIKLFFG